MDAALVRQKREALGMPRARCAALAGVSLTTLKNVERGRRARPKTVTKIAGALGVDRRLLAWPEGKARRVFTLVA